VEYFGRFSVGTLVTCRLTPLAISVLALLRERPMHPYEMYQLLVEREETRIVKVRPGSLYHAVERLASDELVVATGTEREGNRPERTTYELTDRGRAALRARIQELLAEPVNEFPIFPVALAESHNLTRDEVLEALARRRAALEASVTELTDLLEVARRLEVAEAYWFQLDYLRAITTTELDWISRLITRIDSKDLTWPTP
jgi:DNA-binding PadR family transcriptional regulator